VYVKEHKTAKLVQASTTACSSSAMLELGTARLDTLNTLVPTRSTRRTGRVVWRRDVTSQVEFGLIPTCRCTLSSGGAMLHGTSRRIME